MHLQACWVDSGRTLKEERAAAAPCTAELQQRRPSTRGTRRIAAHCGSAAIMDRNEVGAKPQAEQGSASSPHEEQSWPADVDEAAKELLSVVASLSGGRVRQRESLPTEDEPASPKPQRLKKVNRENDSLATVAPVATSGATGNAQDLPNLALQQLRTLAANDEMQQAAKTNARVEKWFFTRWYAGTVLGSCDPPREGRVTVHFDDLPHPGQVDVDTDSLRLIRGAPTRDIRSENPGAKWPLRDSAPAAPTVATRMSPQPRNNVQPTSMENAEVSQTVSDAGCALGAAGSKKSATSSGSAPGLELKTWAEQQQLAGAPIIGQTHGFARAAADAGATKAAAVRD